MVKLLQSTHVLSTQFGMDSSEFYQLVEDLNNEISQINSNFGAVKIDDKTLRVYLDKKSILTIEYVYSDDPYFISSDYKGVKDVINLSDEKDRKSTLVEFVEDYLQDLNLMEREKIEL